MHQGALTLVRVDDVTLRKKLLHVLKILWDSPEPIDIIELSNQTGLSERTLWHYLPELVQEGVIESTVLNGKRYFYIPQNLTLEQLITKLADVQLLESYETPLGPSMHPKLEKVYQTKIEEIVDRLSFIREINRFGGKDKLREEILKCNPRDVVKDLLDAVDEGDFSLPKFLNRMELASLKIIGDSFFEELPECSSPHVILDGVMAGTDASRDEAALAVTVFGAPVVMELAFSGAAAYVVEYEKGIKRNEEILRKPKFPMTAAEEHLEELSSKFPELEPHERGLIAYIYMDRLHFALDEHIISLKEPKVLFRDGPVRPGYSYYSIYTGLYPDSEKDVAKAGLSSSAWQALEKAASNARKALTRNIALAGVVKTPSKPLFSVLIDWALKDIIPGWKPGILRNDQQILNLLMNEREMTCVIQVNTKWSVLGRVASSEAELRELLGKHLGRFADPYLSNLEALNHYSFFLNTAGFSSRYDVVINDPCKCKDLAQLAYFLSGPAPRMFLTKKFEVIPSLVAVADKEASSWVATLSELIQDRLVEAIYRAYGKGD